ncbi:hypothetical protein [Novosphingobium sp. ST904]|uniref:hypothetical protein n=1 Tax=Novosphingobium sp. ST904 TaxID=1684385 RepID=UPI0006C8BE44|nr:hypothetical protein [Novosphingobium sp. ST904]KPH66883.1 hypothetical protein ADT71_03765 [Novosphingobium sp. ST904]TCM39124.1 hypothetical protein EDF59_1063 [Novosphingobium sp. ST904]
MSARCPHCSGNIAEGAPVTRGKWWLGPSLTYYDGEQITLPRAHSRTLYAIAYANGEPVTHNDLPNSSASSLAGHIRALRRTFGDRLPIRGFGNRGFVWDARA